ncbi:MAG: copper resistance protein B [Pseudomonadota bacterium]|nr:copper resistance protein B [Pseudomonadota bacterium]
MSSMPGMTMETPKDKAGHDKNNDPKKSGKKAKATSAKAPAAPASRPSGVNVDTAPHTAAPMDHANMPGMHHDMPGMATPAKEADVPKPAMDHSAMPGMSHAPMPEAAEKQPMDMGTTERMDMDSMMKSMQGGPAPADARDPDTYADGLENGHMPGMDMADNANHVQVLLDRVEQFHSSQSNGQAVDAQAWAGGDIDKLWLKVDGERADGKLGATRTEALWNHAIATYWGLQAGARHDFGDGPGRTWAAFGFQGLSPYWFDIQATAYVGQSGRTALRFEAEYDLLLTQRLVLQPDIKVSLYGKNDPDRDIGAGLSDIDAGLRLRYELSRKFAPYIGVVWNRKFANTARYARGSGNAVQGTAVVIGLHAWF